jgi:bacteriocin-like protein
MPQSKKPTHEKLTSNSVLKEPSSKLVRKDDSLTDDDRLSDKELDHVTGGSLRTSGQA